MKQDLITLSEQFPGIMVQVSLEDLLTAGRTLSEEIIERIDQKADYAFQNKPQQEEFITREETCNKLGVSNTTLWRWKKCGYLVPVQLGAMDRYRISDINAILIKKGGTL